MEANWRTQFATHTPENNQRLWENQPPLVGTLICTRCKRGNLNLTTAPRSDRAPVTATAPWHVNPMSALPAACPRAAPLIPLQS